MCPWSYSSMNGISLALNRVRIRMRSRDPDSKMFGDQYSSARSRPITAARSPRNCSATAFASAAKGLVMSAGNSPLFSPFGKRLVRKLWLRSSSEKFLEKSAMRALVSAIWRPSRPKARSKSGASPSQQAFIEHPCQRWYRGILVLHSRAKFNGGLFTAAAAEFPAPPLPGLQQRGFMEPTGEGRLAPQPGCLSRQAQDDVLRALLRRLNIGDPAHGRGEHQVHVALDKGLKRPFRATLDEFAQQLLVCRRFRHLFLILPQDGPNRNWRVKVPAGPFKRCRKRRKEFLMFLVNSLVRNSLRSFLQCFDSVPGPATLGGPFRSACGSAGDSG